MNSHSPASTSSTSTLAGRPDAIAVAAATPRYAPYRYIHKGLRALMFSTLQRSGAMDASQAEDRAQIVDDVERLLATCADHLAHENQFFHDALRQRAPRAVLPFHEDHLEHLEAISALGLLLQRLRDAPVALAPALAYELYLRLSVFIGENLAHMAEEESALTQALWAHFSDAEIAAMETALQATLAPHEMAFYLRWMVQGMNANEIASLMAGARANMPAEVFAQTADTVQAAMPASRWAQVARALGLPPVPGLMTT
jgi:Xaa-Pro aminopeptidase